MTLRMTQMVSAWSLTQPWLCLNCQGVEEVLLPVTIDGIPSPSVTRLDEKMT